MVELQWWVRFLGTADPFMLEMGLLSLLFLAGCLMATIYEKTH